MSRVVLASLLAVLTVLVLAPRCFADPPVVVFSTDFETGLPAQFSAPGAVIEGVQGYSGLGPVGRRFGGNFLHYTSVTLFPTTLTVRNLPAHDHLSVKSLLAIIDSWDGTEIMQISVDGNLRFANRFSLALADTTTYSPAPPGAILSMGRELGFSLGSYYARDRAYDLGVEPAFLDLPHTADSVVVAWTISALSGPAADQWQGGGDESWGIDAISVEVSSQTTGVGTDPASVHFAVRATPNPARDGLVRLQLVLPASGGALVELIDLAGRQVSSRELDSAAAGKRSVELPIPSGLAPGLYFARVTQGAAARATRVIVQN
ncbi:MAG TPA: T9SS type A sorting domain-containing protein [Candidatus Eisenbacteria bacterium]|jgi:hypothetical protein